MYTIYIGTHLASYDYMLLYALRRNIYCVLAEEGVADLRSEKVLHFEDITEAIEYVKAFHDCNYEIGRRTIFIGDDLMRNYPELVDSIKIYRDRIYRRDVHLR